MAVARELDVHAAHAAQQAGRTAEAQGYFTRAVGYRDQFYGQLASERIGQPLMPPSTAGSRPVAPAARITSPHTSASVPAPPATSAA